MDLSLRKTFGLNNIRDPVTGFTCLHHASLNGHSECVRLLLEHGAKPNALDYKGSSALHLASWAGNLEVVKILLGAELPILSSASSSASTAANSEHQQQHLSEDQQQQRPMVEIDLCNNDNQTPISLAAQFGHHDVVGELLAHGANASIRNTQLESPLDLACLNGRLETVDLLLKSSSPNFPFQLELQRPKSSLFLQHSSQYSPAQVQSPLRNTSPNDGKPTSAQSQSRRTSASGGGGTWSSLLLRTKSFSRDIEDDPQRELLQHSGDSTRRRATLSTVDLVEKHLDHSPLHYAVRRAHLDIIRLLLYKYSANLLQTTTRGSILHEVATNGFGGGKHGEVLALIFDYVRNTVPEENRGAYLDRLFKLKNAQTKDVFQILNDINNRSAQEIKRLIYVSSERLTDNKDSSQQHEQNNKQQQQVTNRANSGIVNNTKLTRQFSDSQQINSFLTLKRGRTNNISTRQPLEQAATTIFNGTQTIDRSYQPKHRLELGQQHHYDQRKALMIHQQQQFHLNSYQPTMTRSVSNLTHVPANYNQPDLFMVGSAASQHPQLFHNCHQSRRSKSRDFGSLLAESKQQMANPMNLYDNTQAESMRGQVWQPPHPQHLVRSQTDCNYLVSGGGQTTGAPQDLGLDRKMINRHYHVYDFEFYPPRLQAQQHQPAAATTAAGIAPSHPEGLIGPNSALRSSTRSNASLYGQQSRANYDSQSKTTESGHNSRLSLDVELNQRQHHQMDRFLARNSKKIGVVNPNFEQDRCSSIEQKSRDEAHQQMFPTDPRLDPQQQHLRQVQSSCSLESHLSEPQLFDSARQAIMRDFDEMIGRELLNRDSLGPIMGTSKENQTKKESSTLTGVMLDMDRYGERLTVSATLNEPKRLSSASLSSQRGTPPDQTKQTIDGRQVIYDLPSRTQVQMSTMDDSVAAHQLAQDAHRAGARLGGRIQAMSLDQTTTTTPLNGQVLAVGRTAAYTEPPKVKPPPPPMTMPPGSLASPLRVQPTPTSGGFNEFQASSPSGNAGQLGLLKMASVTSSGSGSSSSGSSSSIMRMALNMRGARNQGATNGASMSGGDPDSGVCTSNSPASLSHESENANQMNESTFSSLPTYPQCEPSISAPKQPKQRSSMGVAGSHSTAAIVRHQSRKSSSPPPTHNELHLPTQRNSHVVGPPSPTTAQMCIEQALGTIERGTTYEASNQTCAAENNSMADDKDLGYENCLDLQRKLRQVDCRTLRELLSEAIDEEEEEEEDDDDDDGDYAASVVEIQSSSDHLSQSSYTDEDAIKKEALQCEMNEPDSATGRGKKRELLLRVVVDDDDNDVDNIEAPDCDSDQVRNNVGEFSVDEESVFYIDSTDLKNIVENQMMKKEDSRASTTSNVASLTDEDLCASVDKASGVIRFTLRKRRMQSEDECQSLNSLSREASLQDSVKLNTIKKKTKYHADEANVEQPTKQASMSETEENDISSSGRIITSSHQLRQWFETNLVGLADYVEKFTQNGFDHLQFLNHPQLINDDTLKLIKIEEESHRLLIVERIASELPLVNFEAIIRNAHDVDNKFSWSKLLEILQLDLPSSCVEEAKCCPSTLISIVSLRQAAQNLTVGHKFRLLSVLDLLEASCEKPDDCDKLIKQNSTESGELEMDTSQTSSSSSKESIKSIVSKPSFHPETKEETKNVDHSEAVAIPQICNSKKQTPPADCAQSDSHQELQVNLARPQQDENVRPKLTTKVWSSNRTSLVSEAARKLEMAAAAAQATQVNPRGPLRPPPPVAAVRKSTAAGRLAISQKEEAKQQKPFVQETVAAAEPKRVPPPRPQAAVKSICWPPKASSVEKPAEEDVPVKKQKEQPDHGIASSAVDSTSFRAGNAPASRLSYQRMLFEEKSKAAAAEVSSASVKTRPKPAPPAKPAKLAISKFVSQDLNQRL